MLQFTVRNRYESLRSNYSIRANLIGGRRKQESTMDGQREDRDFLGQYTHRLRRDTRPAKLSIFTVLSSVHSIDRREGCVCARVCVIGSAPTYDPSDSPERDSGPSLLARNCQNVRRSIRAANEAEAKTERERERGGKERRSTWNRSRLLCHRLSGDPGLPGVPP